MLKIILIAAGVILVIWIIKSIASSHLTPRQLEILNKPIVQRLTWMYIDRNINSPCYDVISKKIAKNLSKGLHPYVGLKGRCPKVDLTNPIYDEFFWH